MSRITDIDFKGRSAVHFSRVTVRKRPPIHFMKIHRAEDLK